MIDDEGEHIFISYFNKVNYLIDKLIESESYCWNRLPMLAKLELSFWLKSIIDLMEVAIELIDLVVSIIVALEALEA